jgi:hypothetical protein
MVPVVCFKKCGNSNLESAIQQKQVVIICGDWNINFIQVIFKVIELKNTYS